MKCQSCTCPATVHFTKIVEGKKNELHLCQSCAEQHKLPAAQDMNLPALLENLISQHIGPADDLAKLACPSCGIRYMEFRKEGRLGCPHDYEVFRVGLEPMLKRIHRARRHVGKSPRGGTMDAGLQAELVELRRKLREAVDAEAYEEAARLRDLVRQKEATDESG